MNSIPLPSREELLAAKLTHEIVGRNSHGNRVVMRFGTWDGYERIRVAAMMILRDAR